MVSQIGDGEIGVVSDERKEEARNATPISEKSITILIMGLMTNGFWYIIHMYPYDTGTLPQGCPA